MTNLPLHLLNLQKLLKIKKRKSTDQLYELIFRVRTFTLPILGSFADLRTSSFPIAVAVHVLQKVDHEAVILWQRAFGHNVRTQAVNIASG
jgi:hypothetical protein